MLERLYELAIDGGGIWCGLCVYLIIRQHQRYDKLEEWVKEEVLQALNAATNAIEQIKEKLNANSNDRDPRDP